MVRKLSQSDDVGLWGWERGRFFVNSASAMSRDDVDHRFGKEKLGDGSVTVAELEAEIGQTLNGTIVGGIGVREVLELSGKSRRTAQKMVTEGLVRGLVHRSPRGLVFTTLEELNQLVDSWHKR
jgi:hypothetical protein